MEFHVNTMAVSPPDFHLITALLAKNKIDAN